MREEQLELEQQSGAGPGPSFEGTDYDTELYEGDASFYADDALPYEEPEEPYEQAPPQPAGGNMPPPPSGKRRKRRKRGPIIGLIIGLVAVVAIVLAVLRWGNSSAPEEIMHDYVMRGSISSQVEGFGMTKAKETEAIAVTTRGTVQDVFVSEGEQVTAGTVLYRIDSPAAQEAVDTAQQNVTGYQKQLTSLYEAQANLIIGAEFAGKLLAVEDLQLGSQISSGQTLGRLVDDSKMKLSQYYSYAYEGDISVGQSAQVSVPAVMQQLDGTVTAVVKVDRVSPEGSRLFRVELTVNNPGTLAEDMEASATIFANGEQISPYEQGALEYMRSVEVKSKVSGELLFDGMEDYQKVTAGQTLVRIDGEDNENEIFDLQKNLDKAREDLEDAQENRDNLQAVAPIDGKVVGLAITPGMEVAANTTVITIEDASQIVVEADVDERSISSVAVGDMVEINQWENITMGFVETVSLSGKFENGMTTFPVTILVDNMDGMLMSNSSITYTLSASQSDDCLLLQSQSVKSVSDPETGEVISVVFIHRPDRPDSALDIDGSMLGVPEADYWAVPVELGISDNFNVEILSGVEEGDEVFCQVLSDTGSSFMY